MIINVVSKTPPEGQTDPSVKRSSNALLPHQQACQILSQSVARTRTRNSSAAALPDSSQIDRAIESYAQGIDKLSPTQVAQGALAIANISLKACLEVMPRVVDYAIKNIDLFVADPKALPQIAWTMQKVMYQNPKFFDAVHRFIIKFPSAVIPKWQVTLASVARALSYKSLEFYKRIGSNLAPVLHTLPEDIRMRCKETFGSLQNARSMLPSVRSSPSVSAGQSNASLELTDLLSTLSRMTELGVRDQDVIQEGYRRLQRHFQASPEAALTPNQIRLAAKVFAWQADHFGDAWSWIEKSLESNLAKVSMRDGIEIVRYFNIAQRKCPLLLDQTLNKCALVPELAGEYYVQIMQLCVLQKRYHPELASQVRAEMSKTPSMYSPTERTDLIWSFAQLNEFDAGLITDSYKLIQSRSHTLSCAASSKLSFVAAYIGGTTGTQLWHAIDRRLFGHVLPLKERLRHVQAGLALGVYAAEERGKILNRLDEIVDVRRATLNNFEVSMCQALEGMALPYRAQATVAGFNVDFVVASKVVLECNGEQYHRIAGSGKRTGRDLVKLRALREAGYSVVEVSSNDWFVTGVDHFGLLRDRLSGLRVGSGPGALLQF